MAEAEVGAEAGAIAGVLEALRDLGGATADAHLALIAGECTLVGWRSVHYDDCCNCLFLLLSICIQIYVKYVFLCIL